MRVQSRVGTAYITQNGKVVRETVRTNDTVTAVMDFIYDESGTPFALKYSTNGGSSFTTYYYVVNLQGDVVKLVTASGTAYATYTYNAWGEVLTATGSMASINPLRYRGYYYDFETGFYYLQSRYYDPVTHRFTMRIAFQLRILIAFYQVICLHIVRIILFCVLTRVVSFSLQLLVLRLRLQ